MIQRSLCYRRLGTTPGKNTGGISVTNRKENKNSKKKNQSTKETKSIEVGGDRSTTRYRHYPRRLKISFEIAPRAACGGSVRTRGATYGRPSGP